MKNRNILNYVMLAGCAVAALCVAGCDGAEPAGAANVTANSAEPLEAAVVLPPGFTKPQFDLARTNLEAKIRSLPGGSHIYFIEAGTPRLLAEVTVPTLKYPTPKAIEIALGVWVAPAVIVVAVAVPEPSSMALLGIGVASVVIWARRRRKTTAPSHR